MEFKELEYIETSCPPLKRGEIVGEHFRELIREGIENFCGSPPTEKQKEILSTSCNYVKERFPEIILEMEGVAKAVGLPFTEIFRYSSFNARMPTDCDTVAVSDHSGKILLGGNADLDPEGIQRKHHFIHRLREKENEIFMLQWAGTLWPFGGMNANGLACVFTSAPSLPGQDSSALPQHLILYPVLMHCCDVPSAIALLSTIKLMGKGVNIGLADNKGNAAMVEKSSCYQATSMGRRITMFRTNHYLSQELGKLSGHRATENSKERMRRLEGMLEGFTFDDAYGVLSSILKTHGTGGLCQHDREGLETWMSLVLSPDEGWVEVCGEKPCRHPYKRYHINIRERS